MLWGIYSAIYGEVNVSVEKCVEIKGGGDYVEKQQSCFISVTLKIWSGRKILNPTTYVSICTAMQHIRLTHRVSAAKLPALEVNCLRFTSGLQKT